MWSWISISVRLILRPIHRWWMILVSFAVSRLLMSPIMAPPIHQEAQLEYSPMYLAMWLRTIIAMLITLRKKAPRIMRLMRPRKRQWLLQVLLSV